MIAFSQATATLCVCLCVSQCVCVYVCVRACVCDERVIPWSQVFGGEPRPPLARDAHGDAADVGPRPSLASLDLCMYACVYACVCVCA